MDPFDQVALTDLNGSAELNDLINLQLKISETENVEIGILEKIVFADHERSYSELNPRAAKQVFKALKKNENGPADAKKIQCVNCYEVFTEEEFEHHACMYDEFHQLNTTPGSEETELQQLQRSTLILMKENQEVMREMSKDNKSKTSNIECSKCCRKFVHKMGLYRHYDMHIGELLAESPPVNPDFLQPVALCVFCGEVFSNDAQAWDHIVGYHLHVDSGINLSEGPAEHSSLDIINNNIEAKPAAQDDAAPRRQLAVHEFVRMIYVAQLFQCEFCDSTFANAKSTLFHASIHSPSGRFQCNTCELREIPLKDILLHRRDECIIFRDIRNPLKNFPRVFVCNVCDEEFRGLEQLLEHRYNTSHLFPRLDHRTNELAFMCERCLDTFPVAPQLIDHFQEKHKKKPKTNEEAETSERIIKAATSRRGGSHQTSTRPRQYLCEVCGKSYTQSSHLWQHLRFHQGVKPFACTVQGCDRKFTIRPDLNDHVRKCHTGERPFLCTICGKRFLTGSVYYQHRLIHRGERRYGCEECGKRFYRADALKNHLRIHSGEKPHNCPECSKAFRQRGDRDKHMKARHPEAKASNSPKKKRVKSFGRGRVKNNTSLYRSKPEGSAVE